MEGFLYKFLNNIMRTAKNITQMFYAQPLVKKLFTEIKKEYDNYVK